MDVRKVILTVTTLVLVAWLSGAASHFCQARCHRRCDKVAAANPSQSQWMLHGLFKFTVNESDQTLIPERERESIIVHYTVPEALRFRQWSGHEPQPGIACMGGRTFINQ